MPTQDSIPMPLGGRVGALLRHCRELRRKSFAASCGRQILAERFVADAPLGTTHLAARSYRP